MGYIILMKQCSKCKQQKDLSAFPKDNGIKSGYKAMCKDCCLDQRRINYPKHKQNMLDRVVKYRESHPEKIKESQRKYYEKNKEARIEAHKKYREKPENKAKESQYRKKWYASHKEQETNKKYLDRYGITLEEKRTMYRNQKGECKICKDKMEISEKIHIDHNHITGIVRGLLCRNCNRGIGYLRDNPIIVQAAADYLKS